MTEPLRRSEEYPLLNPDEKDEKSAFNQQPVIPIDFNVTCAPKRWSWISRWPQFISACWMSVVLLTILFIIFYSFGSIYRLQSMVIVKYNDPKPAGGVYYDYLVRDNSVPFKTFENYLSFMATKYPLLKFNVLLLIDDTPQSFYYFSPRNTMRFRRFIPTYSGPIINFASMKSNDRDIEDIQKKHSNVNVSVLSLSKYTANTPLQYKYRSTPMTYLPFYVRAYEIWKNGGIGLNLLTQSYRFNALKRIDFKLDAILKQHSKCADLSKYTQALNNIDSQDEREFFAFLFDAFNEIPRMIYQTFYNFKVVSDDEDMNGLPVTSIKIKRSTISNNEILKNTIPNDTKINISNVKTEHANKTKGNDSKALNTTQISINGIKLNDSRITKGDENQNNAPHYYHVYELPRLIDDIAAFHEIMDVENKPVFHNKNNHKNYLTLDTDGSIMAAYSQNHPFLFKLLYTPKILSYSPRYILCNTIRESCFRSEHSADYCDSIKVLNYL